MCSMVKNNPAPAPRRGGDEILQITLTPEESKRFIAAGLLRHEKVRRAAEEGAILFKGGSTVSAAASLICGEPVRVCGLISKRGATTNLCEEGAHVLLWKDGEAANIDSDEAFLKGCRSLGKGDLVLCGANAIDAYGNAAMMTGSHWGGDVPSALAGWACEGVDIIVPVGCEKMIPGDLRQAAARGGRLRKTLSFGMAVGLALIPGEIFTEAEAAARLAEVEASVIGGGGLCGGEGSVTMDIIGVRQELEKIYAIVNSIKSSTMKGGREICECAFPSASCGKHPTCIYRGMDW